MAYTEWTATFCNSDPGCDHCQGEVEQTLDYDGNSAVEAQKDAETVAKGFSPAKVACRIRGQKRKSWYEDVWGWVGAAGTVVIIIVLAK